MKALEQLVISPAPWKIIPTKNASGVVDGIDHIVDADGGCVVETDGGYYPPNLSDARLIVNSPRLYDRLYLLINEIDKVLDHTTDGAFAVINCDCSGIELAAQEGREVLDEIAGGKYDD